MENECKKFIDFIITQKCTYKCPYCSQSKEQDLKNNEASQETINSFFKLLNTLDKDFEITITGGEATTEEVSDAAASHRHETTARV